VLALGFGHVVEFVLGREANCSLSWQMRRQHKNEHHL